MFSKRREIAHAAEHAQQQPGIGHGDQASARACGATSSFISSMRTRSRESWSSPSRPAMQAAKPRGIGMIAGAIGGVKAEEAQDAQIVFRDALARIADEAHAARGEIGEPADIVVDRAVARRRQRVDGEVAPLGVRLASRGRTRPWRGGRRSRRPGAASSPRTAACRSPP